MKPLVIYHSSCMDGFGAAFAAWLAFGSNDVEYLPMGYEDRQAWFASTFAQDRAVSTIDGRDVYILDFSFDYATTEYIFSNANSVVWLDHHKTAFEMWCPTERNLCVSHVGEQYVKLDNNKSGTTFTRVKMAWGGRRSAPVTCLTNAA